MFFCMYLLIDLYSYGFVFIGVLIKVINFVEKFWVFMFGDSFYNWRWSLVIRINCRKKRNKVVNKGKRLCCFEKLWYKLCVNENYWENGVFKWDSFFYRDI